MDNKQITSVTMTTYITFSIVFFTMCLSVDMSVVKYLFLFLTFTFIIQMSMNMWASSKLCNQDSTKKEIDLGKSLGYTLIPWALILGLTSMLLYVMPGWVRVFSNTIGLAIVKSMYYDLFKVPQEGPAPEAPATDGGANQAPTEKVPKELLAEIYHDPSKLINEAEYLPDFFEWKEKVFDTYLKQLPYFDNSYFSQDGLTNGVDDEGNPKLVKTHPIYQLFRCVATKEKIGYFVWLFLTGAVFVLTSLSQMYESDC